MYSETERRYVFKRGDYIHYKDRIGRLDQILTHDLLRDTRRVFAIVTPTIPKGVPEGLTRLDLLQLGTEAEKEVIGLPAIDARRLYVLPVRRHQGKYELATQSAAAGSDLIHVNWRIQFL